MIFPKGIFSFGRNIGIKDNTLDFAVIYCDSPFRAAAVFTLNNFPGAPIVVGRDHVQSGELQAIVINSKNSNVATGNPGIEDAKTMCRSVAKSLGISERLVLPSSTGVIGVPLPMDKIIPACLSAKEHLLPGNLDQVADAIMTTDKRRKISVQEISTESDKGVIFGIAKGAGMIEPNMATMLSYIISDFLPETGDLKTILKEIVDLTYNCLTIDSDTSTSDTVVLLCSGKSGTIPETLFREKLFEVAKDLTKQIARDGEGATKLIELNITGAKSDNQARKIGKSVLNSPLVKTAIYGADPNWGRFVMAIGKVFDEPIPFDALEIFVGDISVKGADSQKKALMSEYLKQNSEVHLRIELGVGKMNKTLWSCDFTEGYIQENAYYTT